MKNRPDPKPDEEKIPLYLKDEGGDEHQLTRGEFYQLRNAHYIEESFIDPEVCTDEWIVSKKEYQILDLAKDYFEHYEDLSSHFPTYALGKVAHDNDERALSHPLNLGLFSRQHLEAGECIGEYHGCWGAAESLSIYSMNIGLDALHHGNEFSFINDGFPNVAPLFIPSDTGAPLRCIFVALENIESGEQICFNQAKRRVKMGGYPLLRTKELEEFAQGADMIKMVDDLALNLVNPHVDFKTFCFVTKMSYLMQTPSALWRLILREVIPYDTSFHIVAGALFTRLVSQEDKKVFENLLRTSQRVLIIKKAIKENEPQLLESFLSTYLELPERFPLEEALMHTNFLCDVFMSSLDPEQGKEV